MDLEVVMVERRRWSDYMQCLGRSDNEIHHSGHPMR